MKKIISVLLTILFCFCLSLAQKKEEEKPIYYLLAIDSREIDLQKLISQSTMNENDKKNALELLEKLSGNIEAIDNYYEKKLKYSEFMTKTFVELLISSVSYRPEKNYPDLRKLEEENNRLNNLLWELRMVRDDIETERNMLLAPSPHYQDLWFDLWYPGAFPPKYSKKTPFPNYLWLYFLLKEKK